jgi:hypothetical protein
MFRIDEGQTAGNGVSAEFFRDLDPARTSFL